MDAPDTVFTGFDSAWTAGNEGAIAHARLVDGVLSLVPPVVAGFQAALAQIDEQGAGAGLHVIGIDQPLIVPNESGRRPVEKAFYPLLGKLKGGMQPSNRGKASMFGDGAPIWSFLRDLDADIDWWSSVQANYGRYAIEVYPAPAIAGLFPVFCERGRLPKYNPANRRTFSLEDWRQLCELVGGLGGALGIAGVEAWCQEAASLNLPRKQDQDKLDAVICVLIAYRWWRWGSERSIVVGDRSTGYIITPVNDATRGILYQAAALHGVPVNEMAAGGR